MRASLIFENMDSNNRWELLFDNGKVTVKKLHNDDSCELSYSGEFPVVYFGEFSDTPETLKELLQDMVDNNEFSVEAEFSKVTISSKGEGIMISTTYESGDIESEISLYLPYSLCKDGILRSYQILRFKC